MPRVQLPALLRPLARGATSVDADGATLRAIIEDLERRFPGIHDGVILDGALRPDVMVAIDGDEVRDLDAVVGPTSEVYVLPAIAGG